MFNGAPALADITETTVVDSGSFATWRPLSLQPQLISIGIATLLIVVATIYFYVRVKNVKPNESLSGMALLMENFVGFMRSMVADVMGVKFVRLTPYLMYLFVYIATTNLTSIIGAEPAVTNYSVPLTMGLVTFIGIFVFGVRYQRWSFLNKYMVYVRAKGRVVFAMINPLEVAGQITPLISLTFRLWGNITAGAIIITLFYGITAYALSYIPIIGAFNFLGGAFAPFLHAFFDMLEGIIQAFVFTLLTATYWGSEINRLENEAATQAAKEHDKAEAENATSEVALAT